MTYNVLQDIFYTNFISSKPNLTERSKDNYRKVLTKFTRAINTTLEKVVTDCKNQQDIVTEKIISQGTDENGNPILQKRSRKFNVNNPDSKIKLYLDTFINYCKAQKNSNNTINSNLMLIKAFLKYYDVQLPKGETLKEDTKKWYLLSKEDFKYIINDSTITHASLIKFLMSSGMRITDASSLTIGDFMEATSEYHDYVDVDEFIDNAPSDMIGTWYFHPHKTMKFEVPCLTFNDPESSNLILQNLRKLKNQYSKYVKRKYDIDRVMSKSDALFGSQKSHFKEPLLPGPVAGRFWEKNKKLRDHHINILKEKISKGELSQEDYEKELGKIPRFHAHACRKYFETMIAKNCGNLRICTLMEGHVSPVSTDTSYIKHDIHEVKETYLAAIPDLSLENTDVKVYTSEARKEMENKISNLENELAEKEKQVNNIEEKLSRVDDVLARLDKLEENREEGYDDA